jgi:hypothetical protein
MLLKNLKKKHPSPSRELFFPDPFKPGDISLIVNEQNVREAINSFPAGSSPGLDGMRPQYLKDIISLSAGEAGQKALRALTKLCNFLLSGQLPSEICHLLYGASLCALNKKDGGIRPIAIGNCLRRLTSKLACFQSRNIVNSYLSPHQLGVATKLGCEAAFLSSINGVKNLVSLLLNSKDNELNIHHYDEALAVWGVANENEIPTIPQFQKNWQNIA